MRLAKDGGFEFLRWVDGEGAPLFTWASDDVTAGALSHDGTGTHLFVSDTRGRDEFLAECLGGRREGPGSDVSGSSLRFVH